MFGSRKTYRVIFVDWSTGFDSVDQFFSRPLGGRLTFLRYLPAELCFLGHDCTVLSDAVGGVVDGVRWLGPSKFDEVCDSEYDFLVTMRGTLGGLPEIRAKRRILCIRDLPHYGLCKDPILLNAFSAAVVGSHYGAGVWKEYFQNLPKTYIIPNGVDRDVFYMRKKDFRLAVFASAPNRGLMRLPLIVDMAREKTGIDFRMCAFSKLGKLHPGEVKKDIYVDGHAIDYALMNSGSIEWLDPVSQAELANILGTAAVMIMPTGFPEICSNSVLQSLASGTPVIATGGIGSTPEFISHGVDGFLTRYAPHDYMVYDMEMARLVIKALSDHKMLAKMMSRATNSKKVKTWRAVAESWCRMFRELY